MGFFNMEKKWAEQDNARSHKLLDDIGFDSTAVPPKDFIEQLSKEFAPHDVDIPRPATPMPDVSRDMSKLDLMRIMIKQNFYIMKQLEVIAHKLDKKT